LLKEMKEYKLDPTKIWTVEEFLQLEESVTPCELINGKVYMSPSPTPFHQSVSGNLYDLLKSEAKKEGGTVFYSPIDLYIDERNVFQPDLVFISKSKRNIITGRGIEGVPDLIVEIISPSNVYMDRNTKKNRYLAMGVPEFWLLNPNKKTLQIYTPETGEEVPKLSILEKGEVTSAVLKNLKFDFNVLFEL
jgi:Uma2 family endonuclease